MPRFPSPALFVAAVACCGPSASAQTFATITPPYTPLVSIAPETMQVVPGGVAQTATTYAYYLAPPGIPPLLPPAPITVAPVGAPVPGLVVTSIPNPSYPNGNALLSASAAAGTSSGRYAFVATFAINAYINGTFWPTVSATFHVNVTGPSGEWATPTATPIAGPAPLSVAFATANVTGPPCVETWNFGAAGAPSPGGATAAYTYATPGDYQTSLTLTCSSGASFVVPGPLVRVSGPTTIVDIAPHDSARPSGMSSSNPKLLGANFAPNTVVTIGGYPTYVFPYSSTPDLLDLSFSTFAVPLGVYDVVASGTNGTATLPGGFVRVPDMIGVSSGPVTPGAPLPIVVNASPIDATSVIYVDGVALPTSLVPGSGGVQLTAVVPAESTTDRSSLVVQVGHPACGNRVSEAKVLPLGTYGNFGIVSVSPVLAAPGDLLDLRIRSLPANRPVTWVFAVNPTRVFPFGLNPFGVGNVLDVVSPIVVPIFDGNGLFPGVPPISSDALGNVERTVLLPQPAAGVSGRLQAVVGVTSPPYWFLTWSCPVSF